MSILQGTCPNDQIVVQKSEEISTSGESVSPSAEQIQNMNPEDIPAGIDKEEILKSLTPEQIDQIKELRKQK